jgi:hypothetical protein
VEQTRDVAVRPQHDVAAAPAVAAVRTAARNVFFATETRATVAALPPDDFDRYFVDKHFLTPLFPLKFERFVVLSPNAALLERSFARRKDQIASNRRPLKPAKSRAAVKIDVFPATRRRKRRLRRVIIVLSAKNASF